MLPLKANNDFKSLGQDGRASACSENISTMESEPAPGYEKYQCKNCSEYNCPNWVDLAGARYTQYLVFYFP